MTTKTKLIVLQVFNSAFQWACLIAGGAAVYYLVVGIQPGEPWTPFFVAVAVSVICKLIAAGFLALKNKMEDEAGSGSPHSAI